MYSIGLQLTKIQRYFQILAVQSKKKKKKSTLSKQNAPFGTRFLFTKYAFIQTEHVFPNFRYQHKSTSQHENIHKII